VRIATEEDSIAIGGRDVQIAARHADPRTTMTC